MDDESDVEIRPEFELFGDERRVRILQALSERLRERPEDPALGFSDLRRAAGIRDSGNFNYHLDHLTGSFVRKTDAGYRLTAAGAQVVASLIVGAYGAGERRGPTDVGDDCPVCGEGLTAVYEDGLLDVHCENDHSFRNPLPPGTIDDRDVEGIVEIATLRIHETLELAAADTCPSCYAQLEWSVDPTFEDDFRHFGNHCPRCGVTIQLPVVGSLLQHPDVVAFYHDHGIHVRRHPIWSPEFYTAVRAEGREDPVRVDVTIDLDGDRLDATLDESLTVIDVER